MIVVDWKEQAGRDVNDRCEVAKIFYTQPKTTVFVFAGRRQTDDKERVRDMVNKCHAEEAEKKWQMFVSPRMDYCFLEFHFGGKQNKKH